jgi:hypothetical protein
MMTGKQRKRTPKKKKALVDSPAPSKAGNKPPASTKASEEGTAVNPLFGSEESHTPSGTEEDNDSNSDTSRTSSEEEKGRKEKGPKEKGKKRTELEQEEEKEAEDVIVDTWEGWQEDYLKEVDDKMKEDFFMGRKRYMEKSSEAARILASTAERNWKAYFEANKKEKKFEDGILVGALYFYQGAPSINAVQKALHEIGLNGRITPIIRTPEENKNYEVRSWNRGAVEAIHETIGKRGAEVARAVGKSFRWKDLRSIEQVVIKITGLPFQWAESDVRKGLFEVGGFPTVGLIRITRILFQGKDSGEVNLHYKFLPERLIGWGRIPKNDFVCSRNKKAHWRILRPPREFEDFSECKHCLWTHGTRTPCEVKITVDKEGWEAAEKLANMVISPGDSEIVIEKEAVGKTVPYTKDPFWDPDFSVSYEPSESGGGGGRGGGGSGRSKGQAWGGRGAWKQ